MNQELKVLLNLLGKFLTQQGCPHLSYSVDAYSHTIYEDNTVYCDGAQISLPLNITKPLEKFIDEESGNFDTEMDDGQEVYQYELEIDFKERTLEIYALYTIYGTDGPYESMEESGAECMVLKENGFDGIVEFTFNGGGDSGYIEDTGYDEEGRAVSSSLRFIEDKCYEMLSHYGGWEINEGSFGKILFNIPKNTCILEFTWNTEEQGRELQNTWKF